MKLTLYLFFLSTYFRTSQSGLCRTRPSRCRGPLPLVPRAASPAEARLPTAHVTLDVYCGGGWRSRRRPVVTHGPVNGRDPALLGGMSASEGLRRDLQSPVHTRMLKT